MLPRFPGVGSNDLILCKASSNRWYVCRANHKPQRRRKPNEILHQTAPILLRNRSAHKKDVRVVIVQWVQIFLQACIFEGTILGFSCKGD